MSKKTVFVETPFLIWAIQGKTRPGQETMPDKARHVVKMAVENKMPLAISTISLAEFLAGVPPDARPAYEREVHKNFIVVPFDPVAARHSAGIQYEQWDPAKAGDYTGQRNVLKADLLVLGCAKIVTPHIMYCDDAKLTRLAQKSGINAMPMPDLPPEQLELAFNGHNS